jgi:CBS domain-containing protein
MRFVVLKSNSKESSMKVKEVMTVDVQVISPAKSIGDAARMMAECDAGSIPVGENDRLVGMVTDRDIVIRAVAKRLSSDTAVREIMSKEMLYCFEDEDIASVAENMGKQKVRRLPVLSRDKRLVGIVSLGDLSLKVNSKAGEAMAQIAKPGGAHDQVKAA